MRGFLLLAGIGATLMATSAQGEVALRWDATGHVVIPAIVDGHGPFDFMFDTGADETAVSAWLVDRLHLPAAGKGEISGATGSEQAMLTRVSALSVDGHEIHNLSAVTLPNRPDGADLGGVVGVDLMAGRLSIVDFSCGTLAILPLNSLKRVIGRHAQLVKAGSIPDGKQLTLPVTINGARGVAMLDSGNRATIINSKFALDGNIDPKSGAFHEGEPARGATRKAADSRVGPIGTVSFAGITREGVVARVADLSSFKDSGLADAPAMILGLDLLKGTRIYLDYSGRRFWIEPSKCHDIEPRRAT